MIAIEIHANLESNLKITKMQGGASPSKVQKVTRNYVFPLKAKISQTKYKNHNFLTVPEAKNMISTLEKL